MFKLRPALAGPAGTVPIETMDSAEGKFRQRRPLSEAVTVSIMGRKTTFLAMSDTSYERMMDEISRIVDRWRKEADRMRPVFQARTLEAGQLVPARKFTLHIPFARQPTPESIDARFDERIERAVQRHTKLNLGWHIPRLIEGPVVMGGLLALAGLYNHKSSTSLNADTVFNMTFLGVFGAALGVSGYRTSKYTAKRHFSIYFRGKLVEDGVIPREGSLWR